ncbi:MAG: YlcI/YnfO family protein [Casimicrobium sp.]
MSQFALRLPNSLHDQAKRTAANDDVSLNQFIVTAVAEKISAMETAQFFESRAKGANLEAARAVLRKVKSRAPLDNDSFE